MPKGLKAPGRQRSGPRRGESSPLAFSPLGIYCLSDSNVRKAIYCPPLWALLCLKALAVSLSRCFAVSLSRCLAVSLSFVSRFARPFRGTLLSERLLCLLSPLRGPLYRSPRRGESRLATLPKGAKEGAKAKGLSVVSCPLGKAKRPFGLILPNQRQRGPFGPFGPLCSR